MVLGQGWPWCTGCGSSKAPGGGGGGGGQGVSCLHFQAEHLAFLGCQSWGQCGRLNPYSLEVKPSIALPFIKGVHSCA